MLPIISSHIFNIFSATVDTSCNPDKTFFGLPTWYKYINVSTNTDKTCNFSKFTFFTPQHVFAPGNIFLILLAILDDLLIIAGVVAVVFVIYGAVQFIIGQGEPERIKHAQGTILNAVIGLVIAIIAAALVNFLGNSLAG